MSYFGDILTTPGFVVDFSIGTATLGDGTILDLGDSTGATVTGPDYDISGAGRIIGSIDDNDLFFVGNGVTVEGGAGNDLLYSEVAGNNLLLGGEGNDTFHELSGGTDTIIGGPGDDRLNFEFAMIDAFDFKPRADLGENGVEVIHKGGQGRYVVSEVETFGFADGMGDFVLKTSVDLIDRSPVIGPDAGGVITGTDMGEVIAGTNAPDRINALGGNDWITPMGGADIVDGGEGIDMVSYAVAVSHISVNLEAGGSTVRVSGGSNAPQQLINIENITGTSFSDNLMGDTGDNLLRGLGGPDNFVADAGADTLDGGAGRDQLRLGGTGNNDVSLLRGTAWAGDAAGDTLLNIEDIIAGPGHDRLTGDHVNNQLVGSHGDDTLMGNAGNDLLYGGSGTDTAVFGYARDQYEITQDSSETVQLVQYIGPGAGDGLDTLLSIEILQFADGDVIL